MAVRIRPRLLVKKHIYVPTVLGWVLILLCVCALPLAALRFAYPFLAYNRPNQTSVCIIEGWVPDQILMEALPAVMGADDQLFVTTGGPLQLGHELSRYRTYAELTEARLAKMGIDPERIVAVPNKAVQRDRTHAAALAVREWLQKHPRVTGANLVTKGPHARRSFVIFKKVLPSSFELGVCSVPPRGYDPQRWWASSEGFRTVVSEAIAYTYARIAGPD